MSQEKQLLVKTEFNWGDEFDISGFAVFSESQWDEVMDRVFDLFESRHGDVYEFWFGTNQAIELSSFQEWREGVSVEEISDEEAAVLKKLFPYCSGFFVLPEE
jgi:hypothetical protein